MSITETLVQTERTVVDRITIDDASFFIDLLNTTDWLRFIGDRNVTDLDDAEEFLRNGFLKSYSENQFGYYLVRIKESLDTIGICGFLKKSALENPDFGFAFLPEYGGQGLASESCFAVFLYGIMQFKFSILDAVTVPDNWRSIRLLEMLDFQEISTINATKEGGKLRLYRWTAT